MGGGRGREKVAWVEALSGGRGDREGRGGALFSSHYCPSQGAKTPKVCYL